MALCVWLSQAAWAQQVWKCEAAGQVRYSDRPCEAGAQPVSARQLQPNLVESIKPTLPASAASGAAAGAAPAPAAPPGNACPGDGEIRGIQTRASSTTLGDAERQFMQDEVRRAGQCRKGQGRYTAADWDVSREAQAAQSQLSDRAREAARLRAEAMHSAADAAEGDRIARQRIAAERLQMQQKLLEQRLLKGGQNAASQPLP